MAAEDNFIFIWRIKNFSMYMSYKNDFIRSPIILVRKFRNSAWTLSLGVQSSTQDFFSCFLQCRSVDVYNSINIEFALSVVTGSSEEIFVLENEFKTNSIAGVDEFITKEILLKEGEKYLPKDTLTIKCCMKRMPGSEHGIDEIIENLLADFKVSEKNSLNIDKCCIETVVLVQTISCVWPVRRCLFLSKKDTRTTRVVFSAVKGAPVFHVSIMKKAGSDAVQIEIRRECETTNKMVNKTHKVKCTLSMANYPRGVDCYSEHRFSYGSDTDVWKFSPPFQISKLEEDGYFELNGDFLYLKFDFIYATDQEVYQIEKHDWDPLFLPSPPSRFSHQLTSSDTGNKQNSSTPQTEVRTFPVHKSFLKGKSEVFHQAVLETGRTDDQQDSVTLMVGDRTFLVNRSLLKGKSEVFQAMLETDMTEKETGVVNITDVEPKTLERLVIFLNSGTVGDLSIPDVKSLYAAADKYMVRSLLYHCTFLLMSSLTMSSVCDILEFADFYQDDRLRKKAEDFISANSDRVLMSQEWKNLMENNLSLAANFMYKMLTK